MSEVSPNTDLSIGQIEGPMTGLRNTIGIRAEPTWVPSCGLLKPSAERCAEGPYTPLLVPDAPAHAGSGK
jgi:hypothetical protein